MVCTSWIERTDGMLFKKSCALIHQLNFPTSSPTAASPFAPLPPLYHCQISISPAFPYLSSHLR
jgi:hypothetical protein